MKYGHFDDANFEYVVDRPDTPRPWTNYLGSTQYGAIITNHAGGYSFYKSAKDGRFIRFRPNNIPFDQPGRYFYLRDRENGDFWSASWQPVGKPIDRQKVVCRHGTAYTAIESDYDSVRSEAVYFVPLDKEFEVWTLKVKNTGTKPRKISAFTFVEFANQWNTDQDLINLQYSLFIVNTTFKDGFLNVAIHDKLGLNEKNWLHSGVRHTFMTVAGAPVAGFDSDRDEAVGVYNTFANPRFAQEGKCRGTTSQGDNACGTFQVDLDLGAGEEKEFMVVLGVGRAGVEGKAAVASVPTVAKAREELGKLKKHWHGMIGSFVAKTPDPNFDSMVNVWAAYNNIITFNWSRAASFVYQGERNGFGFRDTVQDICGAACNIPKEAGERVELMLTGQCASGGALHVVQPFNHHPGRMRAPRRYRSDDCLWFFNAVPEYVKETGDLKFYDKVLPFANYGRATVLGHLRRALEFNLRRTGKNGIPAGLLADWNDCLNLGDKGETFFVAMQVVFGLREYIDICTRLRRSGEVAWAKGRLAAMKRKIERLGWDGAWFIRAIRKNGAKIGTKDDPEASIFLNTQSWAVLSGVGTLEQRTAAMDSVHEKLNSDYGILLCAPPFHTKPSSEISAMVFNDGSKENAGIFCHPQGWAVMAEAILGRGDRAFEYFTNFMPSHFNDRAEIRQIEPYVYNQSTHSKYSRRYGQSRVPWLSGTATWAYFSATHSILGVRPEYDGVTVDPCVPSAWKEFSVSRKFRGKQLEIKVSNPSGAQKGVRKLVVNGEDMGSRTFIPFGKLKDQNEVVVTMGA
jgi:cellobiose phosphorylase